MDTVRILCGVLLVTFGCILAERTCPEIANKNCKCLQNKMGYRNLWVKCVGIDSPLRETALLKGFENHQLIVNLEDVQFEELPANFFGDMAVQVILVNSSTHLKRFNDMALDKLKESLENIQFINSGLVELPNMVTLHHLLKFYAYGAKFFENDKLTVKQMELLPTSIEQISIRRCGIKSIEAGTFLRFTKMKQLNLGSNKLTSVPSNTFPKSLTINLIRFNRLTDLPAIYGDFAKSIHLSFAGNPIKGLKKATLKPFLDADINVHLAFTKFDDCKCDLKWLVEYFEEKPESRRHYLGYCKAVRGIKEPKTISSLTINDFKGC